MGRPMCLFLGPCWFVAPQAAAPSPACVHSALGQHVFTAGFFPPGNRGFRTGSGTGRFQISTIQNFKFKFKKNKNS